MALTKFRFVLFTLLILGILGLGAWLRLEVAERRMFHADEGVQAYQAWTLAETGEYTYDPQEHHGPFLYYVTALVFPLLSDEEGVVSDLRIRLVPLVFTVLGLGCVGFGLLGSGGWEAVLWTTLAATGALGVVYGSYYVQEPLFAVFSLGFYLLLARYLKGPSLGVALLLGVAFGLMHVCKETAVIHGAAAIFSVGFLIWRNESVRKVVLRRAFMRDLGIALLVVATLHTLFFSSFFRNPAGIVDGVATYFNYADRAGGQGHEKPFDYYWKLFIPSSREGIRWGELAFLLASLGSAFVVWQKRERVELGLFWFVGLVLFFVYSLIPYKTPWLMLTPYLVWSYPVACLLVELLSKPISKRPVSTWSMFAVGMLLLIQLGRENYRNLHNSVFRFPSSTRNPYLYVHTTPQYAKLLDRLKSVDDDTEIAVFSSDAAWPIPWHLRGCELVGYWTEFEDRPLAGIQLIDTTLIEDPGEFSSENEFWELHGLRPNTLLALRAEPEIAKAWIRKSE